MTPEATPSRSGFLLSRHWRDTPLGVELTFWVSTPEGPVRLDYPGQEVVFFLPETQLEQCRDLLRGARLQSLELRNFQLQSVVGCYFRSQKALVRARETLKERGLEPLEADLRPTDRFLMERFVRGGLVFAAAPVQPAAGYTAVRDAPVRGAEHQPELRVVSLDIETAIDSPELYSIGLQGPGLRRVMMVGEGTATELLQFFPDEASLIRAFLRWAHDYDPDIFIGWNVVGFDFWFLQRCCLRLRIPFELGRDRSPVHWREMDDGSERRVISIAGRVVLDGIDLLKTAGHQFDSYALQSVAMAVLGEGKLLTGSGRGEDIAGLFRHNKQALAEYNIQDCQLVSDIFRERGLIEFALARSQLTGLSLDRIGGSVAAFDFQYLPLLHREGFVAPARGSVAPQASPGGYVLSSQPGLFRHVLVLDFKSLYPSIIRSFCIDPMGMALALAGAARTQVPGFAGGCFDRERHVLPAIIEQLWQARDRAKRAGDSALSQAIKIIMNSFYGVLGTPGCRFFDPRLASSITRRGHQIITESRDYIEQQGYPVIYGDTDSVFVLVPDCIDNQAAEAAGRDLQSLLNRWWRTRLAEEFGLDSVLEIEFETHFERFFMPTVRGSDQGSKKRYAGIVTQNGERQLIFKGLESVRSDWTELAREFQQKLYWRVLNDEPWDAYVRDAVAALYRGDCDHQLVYRKRLRQSLSDYQRNVPPHVQAARRALERGADPAAYRRGEWVSYVLTLAGPEPVDSALGRLDYDAYLERQLAPVADSMLQFFETSLEQLVAPQMGMF